MNFSNLSLGKKLVLIGAVLGVISLFLPWVDAGIISVNGFQQEGYFLLAAFIYPVIMILKQSSFNKKVSGIILGLGLLFMLYFKHTKSTNLFGASINVSGIGMYLMIIALIISLIGIFMDRNENY